MIYFRKYSPHAKTTFDPRFFIIRAIYCLRFFVLSFKYPYLIRVDVYRLGEVRKSREKNRILWYKVLVRQ